MEPEFLSLFSNTGSITIQVRFKNFDGSLREQRMNPHEISKLIDPNEDCFISRMFFDNYPMNIERVEIAIPQNRIILHVFADQPAS